VGDGPEAWGWAAATGVLWGLSYVFWRRLQATAPGDRVAQLAPERRVMRAAPATETT
jgi:hypothetical protein